MQVETDLYDDELTKKYQRRKTTGPLGKKSGVKVIKNVFTDL